MPTWLEDLARPQGEQHPLEFAVRLALGFALGLAVAFVHRRTGADENAHSFRVTLVLLTILIAAVTQVIGDSVARAFSLVGALSIVRFRTVVQDTRDTVFVIFAVTLGMAMGAGNLGLAIATLVVVAIAAALTAKFAAPSVEPLRGDDWQLTLRVALGTDTLSRATPVIGQYARHAKLTRVATIRGGAALETSHRLGLREGAEPLALIDALNQIEGVQACELGPLPVD